MATRIASTINDQANYITVTWTGLLKSTDDVGSTVAVPSRATDLTVQLSGVLGTGGVVTMQGSNDGATWGNIPSGQLLPSDDSVVSVTLAALSAIAGLPVRPLYIRPKVTAGDGTTALIVTLAARIAN